MGRGPQFDVTSLLISALVRRVVTEIMETERHRKPIRGLLRVNLEGANYSVSTCLSPLDRQNTNPRGGTCNNTETNEIHSRQTSRHQLYFKAPSVQQPLTL
jgi:hypothetical protein